MVEKQGGKSDTFKGDLKLIFHSGPSRTEAEHPRPRFGLTKRIDQCRKSFRR